MKIARIGSMNQEVPPVGYGGTQRSMAQMTVFQAATKGHDIFLYAPEGSGIIDFAKDVSERMGLAYTVTEEGKHIDIVNKDTHTKGSITLRTTGKPAAGYGTIEERKSNYVSSINAVLNQELLDLMIRDDTKENFDLMHLHARAHIKTLSETPDPHKNLSTLLEKSLLHVHGLPTTKGESIEHPVSAICISKEQEKGYNENHKIPALGVAYHGLDSFSLNGTKESAGYLLSIGRIIEKKGIHRAIEIAKRSNKILIIAGTTSNNPESEKYFREQISDKINITATNLLDELAGKSATEVANILDNLQQAYLKEHPDKKGPIVISVGEAKENQKQTLYGNAEATLFPISWPEPFGRILIESFATGTPVIGYKEFKGQSTGSVNEVIEEGVTGFKVTARTEEDGIQQAVQKVGILHVLDRQEIRKAFERNWSSERTAEALDELYKKFVTIQDC